MYLEELGDVAPERERVNLRKPKPRERVEWGVGSGKEVEVQCVTLASLGARFF